MRERVLKAAVDKCHRQVNETALDMACSGSTLVSVVCMQDRLVIANVGDSRAILGSFDPDAPPEESESGGQSRALWRLLSRDHKPHVPLEMERIVRANGRVECVKDLQGNDVGPMRVWLKGENSPGLAMSRSIGDRVAH